MWIPLFWFALQAAPAAALEAAPPAAASAAACERTQQDYDKLQQRVHDEAALRNLRIEIPLLSVWDGPKGIWRDAEAAETQKNQQGKLRIVHFWAPWCNPCVREFPLLRDISRSMMSAYKDATNYIYVSVETEDLDGMKDFFARHRENMPVGLQFGDFEHELRKTLAQVLPQQVQSGAPQGKNLLSRQLQLPMTVVLDEDNVVRLAFIGSLEGRRAEFANGIERLYRLTKGDATTRAAGGRRTAATRRSGAASQ